MGGSLFLFAKNDNINGKPYSSDEFHYWQPDPEGLFFKGLRSITM